MTTKVLELKHVLAQDGPAGYVSTTWDTYNGQRRGKLEQWGELRNYLFATDTTTTSNSTLPWKNTTTLPKLCQIRDNLHSNYISALFPNDKWLSWEAYDEESATHQKAHAVTSYMLNKARQSDLYSVISKALYDYIDYGNAFLTAKFVSKSKKMEDGTVVPEYIGPQAVRISPENIVFNPLAPSFDESWKIVRSQYGLGELLRMAQDNPEESFWKDVVDRREKIRNLMGGLSVDDFNKMVAYEVDGFGNMYEYFMGSIVEVLEFYGDFLDPDTNELRNDRLITIVDRSVTVRDEQIPTWLGGTPIYHAGWRQRPDNVWCMGPLDNLVGLQYRIDHLENLKADAMDLTVHPPIAIIGDVEAFTWGPSEEIHLDEGGKVQLLNQNLNYIIQTNQDIQLLENKMELYAGAPREAMGIRTPGEKTAFEVQTLNNAAGRIFQEKVTSFELQLLEPVLNAMFETARRNLDGFDLIRTVDAEFGTQEFMSITREDITSNGKIRPVGARHFAQQAQDLQNLVGIFSSPIGQIISPHVSSVQMAEFLSNELNIRGYKIFQPNVAVREQQVTQGLANQAQEDLQASRTAPVPEGM